MNKFMHRRCYWPFVAALAFAITPIIAPNDAHAAQPVPNTVADVSISAPAPPAAPLGATMPTNTWAPASVPFDGGPRETLAECMGYWDAGTHMSKAEWRRACQRTQDGTRF